MIPKDRMRLAELSHDMLFTVALQFDLPDLLRFCASDTRIDKAVCEKDVIWNRKLEDFPDREKLKDSQIDPRFPEHKLTEWPENIKNSRELYTFLWNLKDAKEKLQVSGNIYSLYWTNSLSLENKGIWEITRSIKYLSNLKYLRLDSNKLTRIRNFPEFSWPSSLVYLNLSKNRLMWAGNKFPSSLEQLDLSNNSIIEIPDLSSYSSLRILIVSMNKIIKLPNLPSSLKELYALNNKLTKLHNLPSFLERLVVANNQLIELPDTLPSSLEYLNIDNNRLKKLPDNLPSSLSFLSVLNNELEVLPNNLPSSLTILAASNNKLVKLPNVFPPYLSNLNVTNNKIVKLPDNYPSSLKYLFVTGNPLLLEEINRIRKSFPNLTVDFFY